MHLSSGAANGGGLSVEDFKSGHYVGTWGPLLSEEGELFSLPDVIRVVMLARVLPHLDAAHSVLTSIKNDSQARCYITRPGRFAVSITRPAVWPEPPPPSASNAGKRAKPSVEPPTNLATVVRGYFRHLQAQSRGVGGFGDADLYAAYPHGPHGPHGQLAILGADASRLFRAELDSVLGPMEPAAEPGPVSQKTAPADLAAEWPAWPKPEDKNGCRLLFEAWERAGGSSGGTTAAADHYGMSGRSVEQRTKPFRAAAGLTREKPNPGAGKRSAGASLGVVWQSESTKANRK